MTCGLLGHKLAHSYSPAIHAEFGGYEYELFEIEPKNLKDFFANKNFHGINVTIPYKKAVMEFCNEISPVAQEIGSVNTVLRRPDGSYFGDNTDAEGFLKMTKFFSVKGKKVCIFGSGGSSLSVSYVMNRLGASEIIVVSRQNNNAEFLAHHKDAAVLVNCTPVGMYPDVDESPVSLDIFTKPEGVLDLIYNPARTRLMIDAQERGIPNIGGLTMLVGQAAVSSEIFTGRVIGENEIASVVKKLRRETENIILIGMPGSGKTTHAKIISEKLNKTFIDTDEEIMKLCKCAIPEIFASKGEAFFREKEAAVIAEFGKKSGLVIATGGGVVTREENFLRLHQNGVIIFTERDINLLSREGRPLSQGDLTKMYENRLPMYRRFADITVSADGNPAQVAQKILEEIYANYCN
ncbi:MAG: shikimate kinase [Clostridiales bacterium]|jgi:shikimate dehydrogenase|nr:shikimate kinase [Clostridiales bacterium]